MQFFGYALVLVHLFLVVWSLGGFVELFISSVPWKPYTNMDFPDLLLPIHWGSALLTGAGFLYGYFYSWDKTPYFMLGAYIVLALLCAFETFGFMTSKTKYAAMITEYIAYTVILIVLFKSTYFTDLFK
jgi:hypothetical protein